MSNKKDEILNRVTTLNLKHNVFYLDDLHINLLDRDDDDIMAALEDRRRKVAAHNSQVNH